jgi:hypothetical protein
MTSAPMRRAFEPALRKLFHLYWRFARGMTLGVRAVVIDDRERVFLAAWRWGRHWRRRWNAN